MSKLVKDGFRWVRSEGVRSLLFKKGYKEIPIKIINFNRAYKGGGNMSKKNNMVPKGFLFVRTAKDNTILIRKATETAMYTSRHRSDDGARHYINSQANALREGFGWDATGLLEGTDVEEGTIVSYIVE